MKKILILLAALSLVAPVPLAAQQSSVAKVVASCGAQSYPAGSTQAITIDETGTLCSASGSGSNAAAGPTGSAVPADASYNGLNVGGTLRGQTGVNPSGSVYAGQNDTTSVNGVTVLTGAGATGTGAQRVTAAQDTSTVAGAAPLTTGIFVTGPSATALATSGNQSTQITQETAIAAVAGATNDAAYSGSGNSTINAGVRGLYTAVTSAIPAGTNTIGNVVPVPATSGGLTVSTFEPAASDNHTNLKNGAGQVYSITAFNNSATVNYLRLYNAASGFNGCNSATNLVAVYHIPGNTSDAGFILYDGMGIPFSTGISYCVVSAYGQATTTNATASAMDINIGYK